jgi:hypothetical protein
MTAEIKQNIDAYEKGPEALENAIRGLSEAQMDYRPFEDAWTIREHVIHTVDMDINAYLRWRICLAESGKEVMVLDEELWTKNVGYDEDGIEENLALFKLERAMSARRFLSFKDDSVWKEKYFIHPTMGKMSLELWLALYVKHVNSHIEYIERNKRLWKEAKG